MPRLPDFEVTITFLTPEQGGRTKRPSQGYRSDVTFPEDPENTLCMIHPEFLNDDGTLYPAGVSVPLTVRANMYVFWDESRSLYRDKIHVGQALQIVEWPTTVATAIVTEIKNLPNDSRTS